MNPLSRKRLHEHVDQLSEDQVEAADRYLRSLCNQDDPVIRTIRAAPVDDEALGDEDRKAIDDGRRDVAAGRSISGDEFVATTDRDMASEQNPTHRNRRRLSERGLARFEVLGRESDRELIRTLARRLAEEGPHADRLRTIIRNEPPARRPPAAKSWTPFATPPSSAPTSLPTVPSPMTERSICEPLSDRHRDHG